MNNRTTEWVEALESGDFKQNTGGLRTGERYCCLGVACEIYAEAHGLPWKTEETAEPNVYSMLDFEGMMPPVIQDWFGVSQEITTQLADLNDNGMSFEDIAAWIRERAANVDALNFIEAEPEGLFR